MRHDEILGLLPRLNYGADHNFNLWLILLELLFWILVAILTVLFARFQPGLLLKAELLLVRISQYKRTWLLTFGLTVIVLRLGLLSCVPVPMLPTRGARCRYADRGACRASARLGASVWPGSVGRATLLVV